MGNFGNYLMERRKDKGITTEYVASHTSLNENILNALENGDHNFFNSYFYFSNFLHEYLDFLRIDRDRFYSEFSEELEFVKQNDNKQVVNSLAGLRYSKFRNRMAIIKVLALVVLLAVFFYLVFFDKAV